MSGDSKLCEVCQVKEFKYKCPRCFKKTCSLACSKKHKVENDCSGKQYDPQEYISSTTLKEHNQQVPASDTDVQDQTTKAQSAQSAGLAGPPGQTQADSTTVNNILVQRDYNFLINVNRQLSVLKNETWSRNKRMLLGQQRPEYTQIKKFKSNESDMELEFIHRRGCRCLLLPKGMKKSNINRSKWDKPLNCFVWTLEWVISGFELQEAEEKIEDEFASETVNTIENTIDFITHKNKETHTLLNIVARQSRVIKYVLPKPPLQHGQEFPPRPSEQEVEEKLKNLIDQKNLKFYIKAFPKFISTVMDPKTVVEVDPSLTLSEILVHKTCIEFPTIYISVGGGNELKGYKIIDVLDELDANAPTSTQKKPKPETLKIHEPPVFMSKNANNSPTQESSSDSDEEPMETPIIKESISPKYGPDKTKNVPKSSILSEKVKSVTQSSILSEEVKNVSQSSILPDSDSNSDSDQDNGVTLDFLAD